MSVDPGAYVHPDIQLEKDAASVSPVVSERFLWEP